MLDHKKEFFDDDDEYVFLQQYDKTSSCLIEDSQHDVTIAETVHCQCMKLTGAPISPATW